MFRCAEHGDPIYLPSRYWQEINRRNIAELRARGIDDIKRTVAQHYFTWVVGWVHEQFRYLVLHTRPGDWPAILRGALRKEAGADLPRAAEIQLKLFTRMLWRFAERRDELGLLRDGEPPLGNPFPIHLDGKLISQDLANAVLELDSIREQFRAAPDAPVRICELGAGYGRNASVFLRAYPRCRYVIVDIPPALFVAQEYLRRLFPERRVFTARCFEDIALHEAEIASADIAFLLPHQAARLAAGSFDLFLNISSLHEMTREQIAAYFALIDRLTRGCFYSKQWLVSRNPHDGIVVRLEDYPVPARWKTLYVRRAKVQRSFFEAMYMVP